MISFTYVLLQIATVLPPWYDASCFPNATSPTSSNQPHLCSPVRQPSRLCCLRVSGYGWLGVPSLSSCHRRLWRSTTRVLLLHPSNHPSEHALPTHPCGGKAAVIETSQYSFTQHINMKLIGYLSITLPESRFISSWALKQILCKLISACLCAIYYCIFIISCLVNAIS